VKDTKDVDPARAWYGSLLQTVGEMVRGALDGVGGPQTNTLWYILTTGSSTALPTTFYIEGPIDFPFIITGQTILTRNAGAAGALGGIVLSVQRATYTDYPSFTSITGSSPPTLPAATHKAQDNVLADWTTQFNGGEILAIGVTSNLGAFSTVSLGLRIRKLGPS
jgi:hypothetical protein